MPTTSNKSSRAIARAAPEKGELLKDRARNPRARVLVGDCRQQLPFLPEVKARGVDLVFADPPFNWKRDYDRDQSGEAWDDAAMSREEYLGFTFDWIDLCASALAPHGAMWINIPDDWAAQIVCYLQGDLKRAPATPLTMTNWCVWHYRFGQNTTKRFINSKVHALYFCKDPAHPDRRWNPGEIAELSDRRAVYGDPRTERKRDGFEPGHRVPMDVWYGKHWGRVQGNNKERRHKHDNQLPEVYLGRVILACSNKGDTVLDPFTGSGTTGVMATHFGRTFIGTEYSRLNAERAIERVKAGPVRGRDDIRGESTAIHPARRRLNAPDE
ncbi:MAG: site-specific DNA-methyltransferase [Planctomycetota bacterium]